jgi:hypothetical protein
MLTEPGGPFVNVDRLDLRKYVVAYSDGKSCES